MKHLFLALLLLAAPAYAGAVPKEFVYQCQRDGGDACVLLTGTLSYPGQTPKPPADQCVKLDQTTGLPVETWNPRLKLHFFIVNWHFYGVHWITSCSKSWWPLSTNNDAWSS